MTEYTPFKIVFFVIVFFFCFFCPGVLMLMIHKLTGAHPILVEFMDGIE